MRKLVMSIAILSALISADAQAFQKPQEIHAAIKSDKPYGAGTLRWTFFDVYDSSIWTDAAQWSYKNPFALSITYKMKFTTQQLVEKSVDEMKRLHNLGEKDLAAANKALSKLFKDVKEGDRITGFYEPESKVAFYYNGKLQGNLTQKNLLIPFMDIWLSPDTERPELRAKLLNTKD